MEEQAKQQVLPALHLHGMAYSEGLQLALLPPPPMATFNLHPLCPAGCTGLTTVLPYHYVLTITILP